MSCTEDGCPGKVIARGLCDKHYRRWRRTGSARDPVTPSTYARFWAKVDRSSGEDACWLWTAAIFHGSGYGVFRLDGHNRGAHRIAWEMTYGVIPAGLSVCHRCDNPPCVNPRHLFLGTDADNVSDRDAKGRTAHNFGEVNGSVRQRQRLPRGTAHHGAKLTNDTVRAIRDSAQSQRELARQFGVSQSVISNVRNGRTWSHVK